MELREVPRPHPGAQEVLEPVIDRVFPFADIAEAFAYLESGRAKGKVVVRMQE